jgi:hypothetical protein
MDWIAMDWQPIESEGKTGIPRLVWDEYYLMRIAKWNHLKGLWMQDLPYGDDPGRGEVEQPLDPVWWMPLPPLPTTAR